MGSEKESTPMTGSSSNDDMEDPTFQKVTPENLKPKDLVGRTILLDQDDGTKLRAKILKFVNNSKDDDIKNSQALKFLISMGKDKHEELLSYQQMLDHINKDSIKDPSPRNIQITTAHHTTSRSNGKVAKSPMNRSTSSPSTTPPHAQPTPRSTTC
jgi:hypothetical protein